MPNYEFECVICKIRFEMYFPMADKPNPICCSTSMKQIYSAPGISFKGDGWGHQ